MTKQMHSKITETLLNGQTKWWLKMTWFENDGQPTTRVATIRDSLNAALHELEINQIEARKNGYLIGDPEVVHLPGTFKK